MAVPENLHPTYNEKILRGIKAENTVKRITFNRTEAKPGDTLYVTVPKLNKNEVLVPGSLALRFDIDLSGGHANNFLVQNVTRALVERMVVKFANAVLEDNVGYDLFKIFEDLFLSPGKREDMIPQGFRVRIYARSAQGRETRKPRASRLKTS